MKKIMLFVLFVAATSYAQYGPTENWCAVTTTGQQYCEFESLSACETFLSYQGPYSPYVECVPNQ